MSAEGVRRAGFAEAPASQRTGPLDLGPWPDKLTARVVTPGPRPAIHGYDVEGDLARHYSFAETVLLAWTGELPTAAQGRAFEVALQFAAPAPINEAPTHAAALARICSGTTSAIQGTAAVALAEQARVLVAEHTAWLDALGASTVRVAPEYRAASDEERACVERLRAALEGLLELPELAHDLSRAAALFAVFRACGLKSARHIECALVFAKLPVALAEAMATPARSFRAYPLLLPGIEYVEGDP
ncbi:MAG: hypothetical protein WBY94_14785 [Polyangiaceae bacterium]